MSRLASSLRLIAHSIALYPVSVVWVVATGLVALTAGNEISPDIALVMLTLVSIIVVMASTHHEVSKIHGLVDSQHDELLETIERMSRRDDEMVDTINRMSARINQLLSRLREAGIPVPHNEAVGDND